MNQTIKFKRNMLSADPPASLADGELALSYGPAMKRLFLVSGRIYNFQQFNPSGGWGNYNVRSVIEPDILRLPADGGDHISITLLYAPGTNGTLTGLYVGMQAGTGTNLPARGPNFRSAPTQLTFGGQASIAVGPGEYTSDLVPFYYDRTRPLLLAAHCSGTISFLEAQAAYLGAYSWYAGPGPSTGSQLEPTPGQWAYYGSRWCLSPRATVTRNPPSAIFQIPADFVVGNDNVIEAIGAGMHGTAGIVGTSGGGGRGGNGGCYAKIVNFDPGGETEFAYQAGEANGTIGPGAGPTANSWFQDATTLLAAGGDTTTANCIGETLFAGGAGGAPGNNITTGQGGGGGGGGGGGAGGPNGPGSAGLPGQQRVSGNWGLGGQGGDAGGSQGGAGGAGGNGLLTAYWGGLYGEHGIDIDPVGSGGGGGGGAGNIAENGAEGGGGGLYGGGGGGGGGTRTAWVPGIIGRGTEGLIVVTYLTAPRTKVWVGTPNGVEQLFARTVIVAADGTSRAQTVDDAADDGIYARNDGQWVQVPVVAPSAPIDPAPNQLWCDSRTMRLYIYLQDQWTKIQLAS